MQVFSSVVAELSTDIVALLPEFWSSEENNDCETLLASAHSTVATHTPNSSEQSSEHTLQIPTNYSTPQYCKAKFLQTQFSILRYDVSVVCAAIGQPESLQVCGAWDNLAAAYDWLNSWVKSVTMNKEDIHCDNSKLGCKDLKDTDESQMTPDSKAKIKNEQIPGKLPTTRRFTRTLAKLKNNTKNVMTKELLCSHDQSQVTTIACNSQITKSVNKVQCETAKNNDTIDGSEMLMNTAVINPNHSAMSHHEDLIGGNYISKLISSADLQSQQNKKKSKKIVNCKTKTTTMPQTPKLMAKEFRCDACNYVSPKERYLLFHKLRVHGNREHHCSLCHRSFGVLKDLNQHMRFHGERFCCEHCGKTLKSRYALMLHIARIHNGAAPRPIKHYLCTLCGKMCRNKTEHTAHRNKEHLGIKPFHCGVCNAGFFARANLRAHEQIHSDIRCFKCRHCDKAFKQRQGLRIHLAIHAADRPYKCDRCAKSFTQSSALVRHVRTHTSSRPYVCSRCPSTFNDCSVLRRHLVGIHKVTDANELRDALKSACAEARILEKTGIADRLLDTVHESHAEQFSRPGADAVETHGVGHGLAISIDSIVPSVYDSDAGKLQAAADGDNFVPSVPCNNLFLGVLAKFDSSDVDLSAAADPMYILPGFSSNTSYPVNGTAAGLVSLCPDTNQYVFVDEQWRTYRATNMEN